MKTTRRLLLLVGALGLAAVSFGLSKGDPILDHLFTIICSTSLIFGYFQIGKTKKHKC
ncbi:hypothetical protein WNY78_01410 [Psychroserpens sp. AS72]|uniref:hypothetical protein n=1 Tax=Psychroserpens sp. AS72 TaxID=3135775 RepID=UPI00317AAD34